MEAVFSYYSLLTLFLLLIWILTFARIPNLRREMIIMSILAAILMPFTFLVSKLGAQEVSAQFANLSIFDFLFSFALGGVAASVYHITFGKYYHRLPKIKHAKLTEKESLAQLWLIKLFIIILIFVWTVLALVLILSLSIPISILIASIILAVYIVSHRRDLLADVVWSALLMIGVIFVASTVATVTAQVNFDIAPISSDITFLGVPIDLFSWSIALGLIFGPLYEYSRQLKIK